MPDITLTNRQGEDVELHGVNSLEPRSASGTGVVRFVYPNGTLPITENGTFDVSTKASVEVNVPTGGGGGGSDSGVLFIDYDGTELETWASNEVASKTALPELPDNDPRLVPGEWNWDLQHIKDYIASYPEAMVIVGHNPTTASGLTEFDITLTKVTGLTVTCNMTGNKDWGDGTQNALTSHTYTDYGDYTITCDGTNLPYNTFGQNGSNVNSYICKRILVGELVSSFGQYSFGHNKAIKSISLPGNSALGEFAFYYGSYECIVLPKAVSLLNSDYFYNCGHLSVVSLSQNVANSYGNVFSNCVNLSKITIPSSMTVINNNFLLQCKTLKKLLVPVGCSFGENVTKECTALQEVFAIGNSTIGWGVFRGCTSLKKVHFGNISNIRNYAFADANYMSEYDFSACTSVPTLESTEAFTGISPNCKIIVPDALYDDWIVATNWSTYANYIYKASEVA